MIGKVEVGLDNLNGETLKPMELARMFGIAANVEQKILGTDHDTPAAPVTVQFIVDRPELCSACGGESLYTGENSCVECSGIAAGLFSWNGWPRTSHLLSEQDKGAAERAEPSTNTIPEQQVTDHAHHHQGGTANAARDHGS
jgi:hypothetical protein